jgi:antitoxin VapB
MALNIKDPETDRLARELARATGETVTEAVRNAVKARLKQVGPSAKIGIAKKLEEIALRLAKLPDLDKRTADEILGYNEHGHFD